MRYNGISVCVSERNGCSALASSSSSFILVARSFADSCLEIGTDDRFNGVIRAGSLGNRGGFHRECRRVSREDTRRRSISARSENLNDHMCGV